VVRALAASHGRQPDWVFLPAFGHNAYHADIARVPAAGAALAGRPRRDASAERVGTVSGPYVHGDATSEEVLPLAEAVVKHLPPGSPVPAYLRRLLLAGGESGRELFRRLYQGSRAALDAMAHAGLAARGADPEVRAAILMSNDLAVLLLREQLADVLGTDPLSAAGMARWGREMLAIYATELPAAPADDEGGGSDDPGRAGGTGHK
jgi:Tetracyclin repressor-like, C-terminal domain